MTSATSVIPSDIGDVDARSLTEALGARVDDVRSEQIAQDTGFSALRYRLHLTGAEEIFRVVDGRITEVWNCGYHQGVWN